MTWWRVPWPTSSTATMLRVISSLLDRAIVQCFGGCMRDEGPATSTRGNERICSAGSREVHVSCDERSAHEVISTSVCLIAYRLASGVHLHDYV